VSVDTDLSDDAVVAAAQILLASGPPALRRLAADGWDGHRLVAERPELVNAALRRSRTLRDAAAAAIAPAVGGTAGSAATLADKRSPAGRAASDSLTESGVASPGGHAEPEHAERRAAVLERKLHRTEQINADLRAKIPSRSDRARHNRVLGQLRRAEREAARLADRVAALEVSTAALVEQLDAVKQERDDALGERDQARRSRAALETRLGNTAARAEYLRHLLPGEAERLADEAAVLPDGKRKTRLRRRGELFERLIAILNEAFPASVAEDDEDAAPSSVEPEVEGAPEVAARARPTLVRLGPTRDWEVLPLGGAEEIGGSALLVAVGGRRILIDAGIRPNARGRTEMLPRRISELGDRLDAIVVTHAHADHAGYVPALTDRFRGAPIVCSPGTAALLPTMWRDSLTVMTNRAEADAEWMDSAPQPLYSEADLAFAEERLAELAFGQTLRVGDIDLRLFPAGHVLGAAGVVVSADNGRGGRVVVTGDISDVRQASVAECELPPDDVGRGADLLVIESTYCHDTLPRREDQVAELVSEVRDVVVNGRGRVLIPAFALGRAQEIALILAEHLPDVPVLIDGLARQISTIYELFGGKEAARITEGRREARERAVVDLEGNDLVPPVELARAVKIFSDTVQPIPDRGRYRAIRGFNRGVVITTSGMLTGGPAVQWAREILPQPRDALFLCGYQDEEAPGRRLAELCDQPESQRRPLTLVDYRAGPVEVPVNARVHNYRLSAHADKRGLMNIIDRFAANEVMLVHGLRHNQDMFRQVLRVRGQGTVRTDDWRRGPT
jgi:Cft2 family RNA processing exonuclease